MATILIVDDRPLNREYLRTLLGACGYGLVEAVDGAEALAKVRQTRPDLVIADILMPTMDGYEFCRQLRRDPAIADTPVIFLTAHYADEVAKSLAESCGVFHIMTKPVEPDVILSTVSQVLGLPAPAAARRASGAFEREHTRLLTDTLAKKANDLEVSNRQLTALIELGQQMAAEHDPKRLLQLFCPVAGKIVEADYTVVAVLDDDGSHLRHVLATGVHPATVGQITSTSAVEGLLRCFSNSRSAVLITDSANDPMSQQLPQEYQDLHSLLVAPIASSTRHYGLLCLGGIIGMEKPNGSQRRLASSLAAQIAVNYENAIRYEQIQRHLATLEEEIANRRRAQGQLDRLNAELEQRVDQRTQELERTHHLLRHSERMAAIGTLSAGLGHDMGNLLFPIRIRLDAMQNEHAPATSEMRSHIDAVRKCMDYLQTLTNGLRMLALDPDEDDVGSPVTELASWRVSLEPLLKSAVPRSIMLEFDFPENGVPPLRIAPHRLTQAVFNLVNNSCDAMRQQSGGRVCIRLRATADESMGVLSVIDTGPGMSDDVRRRAVEPFFTTKRRALSTGLGLSLVHSIVDAAGGTVEIDSELGRGTTIALTLPLAGDAASPSGMRGVTRPVAALALGDERFKALVHTVLESIGYQVRASGEETSSPGSDANVLVVETGEEGLETARAFMAEREDRRVAVFGEADDRWSELGAIRVGNSCRLSELRRAFRRLLPAVPSRSHAMTSKTDV
ncbi:MAG: response regulator [Phycisphaerales bacterium]|nr:response regulator [Phycisphaerales bacterium]